MESIVEAPQKHFLNRVTPFSKILAFILFVTLPIITLYIGYQRGTQNTASLQQSAMEGSESAMASSFPWAKVSEATKATDYYIVGSSMSSVDYYPNGDANKPTPSYGKNIETMGVDVPSFEVGNGPNASWVRLAKDKNAVYYSGKPIIGADLNSFSPILDPNDATQVSSYAKDAQHVYRLRFAQQGESAGQIIPNADPATFTLVGWVFAKDKNTVWSARAGEGLTGLAIVDGADAATFSAVLLKNNVTGYFKDKNYVYWLESVIPDADPATFVVDSQIAEDPCPGSVCPAEYNAHDKVHSYQGSKVVK